MYDTSKTKVSLGVLIELSEALRLYQDSFALAGGWAPYFITKNYFDHCGSLDIDLVLKPSVLTRYESIREIITQIDFTPTDNPFRFKKNISEDLEIELDFLSEPEAIDNIPQDYVRVQRDLTAVIIPGSSIVFKFNFEADASGRLSNGSELLTKIRVADIVSMIGLKGHALGRPLKLEKDCYDIYGICGFANGSPEASAKDFLTRLRDNSPVKQEKDFIDTALERLKNYFNSENSRGPIAVSRFYGMDEGRRIDSYMRVHTFLSSVQ